MSRWWGLLVLVLVGCGGPPEFTVSWTATDAMCIDAFRQGWATEGARTLQVQVTAEKPNGDAFDASGRTIRLFSVVPNFETLDLLAEEALPDSGELTFDVDLTVADPEHLDTAEFRIGIEGTDEFETGDLFEQLTLTVVPTTARAWTGCQEWRDRNGVAIPPEGALAIDAPVTLSFHAEGDLAGADQAEITFRERGGDLCGPDPFGTFLVDVADGQNDVPWTVSLEGMDPCSSEDGFSELTFSTPSWLNTEGAWEAFSESAEREVLP